MPGKLARLGKDTAIYGLSTVVGRLLNFLLVPFYTNVLVPSEYGVIANLYAYIAFATVFFGFGMEQAYMRFFRDESGEVRHDVYGTAILFATSTSLILATGLSLFSSPIANLIGLHEQDGGLIQYAAWILCFDAVASIPFAALRMKRKAKQFALLKIFNITFTLVLNCFLILVLWMKASGVVLANLIASGATLILVLLVQRSGSIALFSTAKLKELLSFGIPFIPSGLAGIAMQIVDRPIVKALCGDASLGVYQANYRLGIFMMLVVNMFDYAWRPFYLSHAGEEGAAQLFSRVLTVFTSAMLGVFVLVSLFIGDLAALSIMGRHIIHPNYWSGLQIVPWVLLAYVFNGMYLVFSAGLNIKKKTIYLPIVTGLGAAINIASNFMLIPRFGILGAALATLISYIVMAFGVLLVSERVYPVRYEWGKIGGGFVAAGIIVAASLMISSQFPGLPGLLFKLGLCCLFIVLLFVFRVITLSDISALRSMLPFSRPSSTPR